MPPKVTVTPDADVKFLLTIIKLAGVGTVRIPVSQRPEFLVKVHTKSPQSLTLNHSRTGKKSPTSWVFRPRAPRKTNPES